jgi:hypothetical protein
MPVISKERLSVSQRLSRDGSLRLAAGGGELVGFDELAGFFVALDFVEGAAWGDAAFFLADVGVLEAVVFLGVLVFPGDDLLLVFLGDFGGGDLSAMVNFEDYSTYRLSICGTIRIKQSAMN